MAIYDIEGNIIADSVKTFVERKYPDIEVIPCANYPHHDATVVGDQIWAFNKPTDGNSKAYTLANDEFTLVRSKQISLYETINGSSKEIEMKSVDYNNEINCLIVGNGSSSYVSGQSHLYLFYESSTWFDDATEITMSNCGDYTMVDVSALGDKSYAFWAYENPDNNMIYVSINMFKDIYLVQLGKGTENLGSGTYASASTDKFNGSYRVLKHWEQENFITGEYGNHGGQAYNGRLYIVNNDSTKNEIYEFILNDDETLQMNVIDCSTYMNGQKLRYRYMDGMFALNGYLYSAPLYVDGAYHTGSNKVVLKIKIPN